MLETNAECERQGELEENLAAPTESVDLLTARGVRLRSEQKYQEAAETFAQVASLLPHAWVAQYNYGAVLLEANRPDDAARAFECAIALRPSAGAYAIYAHALALCGDIHASRGAYERALTYDPLDFDANWGLFEVDQLLEDNAAALHHQQIALAQRSVLSLDARVRPAHTTILELCIAGTFQANIPLDFILDRDRITVHKLYLGEHPVPALPAYDIVFNTIADAPNACPALDAAAAFIAGQDRPALNAPALVPLTSRDSIALLFRDSDCVTVAHTRRATQLSAPHNHPPFPLLIRPIDSHAGKDLAKIDSLEELRAYLAATSQVDEFYLSAFIDYRNADGYFRKYRIVFVDGVAYPVHMAVSPRWMIHYYNAPMAQNAWMRDEEHVFMRDIGEVFGGLLAGGLRDIAQAIPLDYFGIDCSIASDGRVLLFEASTANIVHLRDPVDLYPYKAQYVPRIIRALERLFDQRLQRAAAS
jgi:tetratricopeptide (TPR) repeat protein